MIKLGQEVQDTVTGFKGIATAKIEYLNGCVQFCIKPKIKEDGKFPEGQYIDVQQIEVVGEGLAVQPKQTGGMMDDQPNG